MEGIYKLDEILSQISVLEQTNIELKKEVLTLKNMMWFMLGKKQEKWLGLSESKKRFWENYPKAEGEYAIIQQANMKLIMALSEICDKLGLEFWLHGGSLIGAIRHNGFIPWDDDVDLGMTRKDLNQLICYLEKNDDDYKIVQAYHDDHTFSRGYQFKSTNEKMVCFIDIFPFDFYPLEPNSFYDVYRSHRNELVGKFLKMKDKPKPNYIAARFALCNRNICPQVLDIFEKGLKSFGAYRASEYFCYSIENYPFPYPLLHCEDIYPLKKMEFEGVYLNAPNNFNKYLQGYKDYWEMPADIENSAHYYYYEPHIGDIKKYLNEE